jgi:hypothetical protein
MMRKTTLCLLVSAALWQGCAPAAEGPGDRAGLAPPDLGSSVLSVYDNGTSLNGTSLNGTSLNGTSLNGTSLNGTSLNGTDLLGSIWSGELSNGAAISLRLDSLTQLDGANSDVSAYGVSYETQGGWQPLCGLDPQGQPALAIPLSGTWNYEQGVAGGGSFTPSASAFTFACRGTAIAKCVELGYKPWQNVASTSTSLQDHHVACTRALRADYCGDGTPHTVNGTTVNLYDNVGVQADTESWNVEAEWTPAGARFVKAGGTGFRYQLGGGTAPACMTSLASWSTGAVGHFANGTFLMNEY